VRKVVGRFCISVRRSFRFEWMDSPDGVGKRKLTSSCRGSREKMLVDLVKGNE